MSKTYQVHVKTVGQMKALMFMLSQQGYKWIDPIDPTKRFEQYPWVIIYTKDKTTGGNYQKVSAWLELPFDQAFDLPVKKESVEFYADAIPWIVTKKGAICKSNGGGSTYYFETKELIKKLQSALDELDND